MQRLGLIQNRIFGWLILCSTGLLVYGMGVVLILDPQQRTESLGYTPVALLISTTILLFFHPVPIGKKTVLRWVSIAVSGYLLEVIGIQTGFVFGRYVYAGSLGFELWNTPLLIGVNWLFLTCACASVSAYFKVRPCLRALLATIFMVVYDVALEVAAPVMNMWYWEEGRVPLQNYISWFVAALCFQWLWRKEQPETPNRMALPLLVFQLLMFIIVSTFI